MRMGTRAMANKPMRMRRGLLTGTSDLAWAKAAPVINTRAAEKKKAPTHLAFDVDFNRLINFFLNIFKFGNETDVMFTGPQQ